MAKTLKQLQPHKFSAGDTVKVVRSGRTEWCKIGDTHTIRICKHDHKGEPVYVVDFDKDDSWIRECNLELVERDRQKGGEWKRHRGNSQPVDEGTWVEVKLRCGDIQQGLANAFLWRHADCDVAANIMKYRVISQAQAEEVEKEVFVGKDVKLEYAFSEEGVSMEDLDWKPIGGKLTSVEGVDLALFGEVEDVQLRDTLSTYKEFTVTGQWHQIEGPLKWRDEVTELNAYIEKFTRERDSLIERLASEGFALIPAMTPVMGVADIDFSDWRNWKAGDIVECTHSGFDKVYTEGKSYCVDHVTNEYAKVADDCGENSFCHINNDEDVKFRLVR